ncbi:MAG: DUF2975 domain-containing protein [Chryseobacterium sp.]|nr:DUF2975 domain-containing protein [Chryseobacterium sp.]
MKNTNFVLSSLEIIFWIVFGGLIITLLVLLVLFACVLFGFNLGTVNNVKFTLPGFSGTFSEFLELGRIEVLIIIALLIVFWSLEAVLIRKVISALNKLDFIHPFSVKISSLIHQITSFALFLGVASFLFNVIFQAIILGEVGLNVEIGGDDFSFLILAGIIYVIGKIYKKGVDLQNENELTI